jgi:uncharacterized protein YndB with AHSA1/START domain
MLIHGVKVELQIAKSAPEIFEAIVNPEQMTNFFISSGSERMEEGKTVYWQFPEFDGKFPVRVGKTFTDKFISFSWDSYDGRELLVEITLMSQPDHSTVVRITEEKVKIDEDVELAWIIEWLVRNTEGWANFLACMKAYLEYGINLRKGAFDFMKN